MTRRRTGLGPGLTLALLGVLLGAPPGLSPAEAAAPTPARRTPLVQEGPSGSARPAVESGLTIELKALADTVLAHQTAWIEIRVTNGTRGRITVPFRSDKIIGEWRFTGEQNQVLLDWPPAKELEESRQLTLAPGETLYEILSPESCFGVLTGAGTVRASCRLAGVIAAPVTLVRRPTRATDRPSALRAVGSLTQPQTRTQAQGRLWTMCAGGGDYFDCDEALYTVAYDRLVVAPPEAAAIVDTLIARSPNSGWCRSALLELVMRLPEPAAKREIDGILSRRPGGVAEAYARELNRRRAFGEYPVPGFKRKK